MRIEVLYELMRTLGLSSEQSRKYATGAFEVFYVGRNQVEFFSGALAMLDTLSRQFPLIALTNGNAHIERAGIDRYFKGAFSAADVGSSKPNPEMFHAALNELDLAPEEAIHVGDNLVDDIRGANSVGMHSIWVNLNNQHLDPVDAAPSVEVNELAAIPDAVAELLQG
jgi:putative hydrolase of the HAD superfamily